MAKEEPKEKPKEVVWATCSTCGGEHKRHSVLCSHSNSIDEYEGGWSHTNVSELVQCLGCEEVRLRKSTIGPDPDTNYQSTCTYNVKVYPESTADPKRRTPSISGIAADDENLIPDDVQKMYAETTQAFDARIKTLAGIGLRAVVEAICVHQGMRQRTLDQKIKALVKKRLLTPPQGDLLHEERYLGNEAAHEMSTPKLEDLEDGLQIIEGLINTIYLLPSRAAKLKNRREKKKAAKATKPPAAPLA